ncbi:MAG: hypothetical protein V1696_02685 [Candidatus Jorgensenbacteria bacterium]
MEELVIFLAVASIIIHTFLYRLQRKVRGVSPYTAIIESGALNPKFAYWLFCINFILQMGVSVLIFMIFGWLWLLVFLLYIFIGAPTINILLNYLNKRLQRYERKN